MACGSNTQPVVDNGRSPDTPSALPPFVLHSRRAFVCDARHGLTETHPRIGMDMKFRSIKLASAVLAVTLTVGVSPLTGSAAANTSDADSHAAHFLVSQLVAGERIETTFGDMTFPDAGLTADVLFALYAANVPAAQTDPAVAWFATQVASYTGEASGDTYAGAVAKALIVADASGRTDLFAPNDLTDRLVATAQTSGRFSDISAFGDFSNTITQSLAIIALHRVAPDAVPAKAATYLASQACPDGGFPSSFDADTCTSSVDATGFAIQALHAAGDTARVEAAAAWLAAELDADRIVDANAAGLAATSFALAGRNEAFDRTQTIINGLQDGCAANVPQAIRFTRADAGDRTRATAQALFGRVGGDLRTVTAPATGVAPGALSCPPRFSDLDYDTSAHAANIVAIQQLGALAGFSDGTLRPRQSITRGQFASLLIDATQTAHVDAVTPFTDIAGDTHARALTTLHALGVITGFDDDTVRSGASITRGQAAAFISRFLVAQAASAATTTNYTDIAGSPFAAAINDVTARGIFRGTNGQFVPGGPLRRDQAATVINLLVTQP